MNLLWYLFGFLASTSAAVTTPVVLLNTSQVAATVANQSLVGNPEPQFQLAIHYDGPKLPYISCLMNTVEFLVILGKNDFSGSMGKVAWKLDNYPEVGMVVSPTGRGESIQRRFVIWGLSQGVAHMIYTNHFQAVTFTLSWEGKKVGTVGLVAWPQGRTIQSTQDTNITAESVGDPGLVVQIAVIEESTLLPFDVFLLVIAVLVDVAEIGATKKVGGYMSPEIAGAFRAPIQIGFQEPTPPRTRPPFFLAESLMITMATIPEYMIKKGVFQEAAVIVEVDGVNVANGFLRKKLPGVGITNVGSNVSVS